MRGVCFPVKLLFLDMNSCCMTWPFVKTHTFILKAYRFTLSDTERAAPCGWRRRQVEAGAVLGHPPAECSRRSPAVSPLSADPINLSSRRPAPCIAPALSAGNCSFLPSHRSSCPQGRRKGGRESEPWGKLCVHPAGPCSAHPSISAWTP